MKKLPVSKQIKAGFIVAGVAFVTSALLALLASWGSARSGMPVAAPSPLIGLSFGTVAGAVYIALAGNKRVEMADDATRRAALSPMLDGGACILVYRRGFVGKLAGVDVYVDGEVRTQLKSPRFAALSVSPGRHVLEAEVQNKRSDPVAVVVGSNETAAVQVAVSLGRSKLMQQQDVEAVRASLTQVPMVRA